MKDTVDNHANYKKKIATDMFFGKGNIFCVCTYFETIERMYKPTRLHLYKDCMNLEGIHKSR